MTVYSNCVTDLYLPVFFVCFVFVFVLLCFECVCTVLSCMHDRVYNCPHTWGQLCNHLTEEVCGYDNKTACPHAGA